MKHSIVDAAEWEKARLDLLVKEKELNQARDALSKARRELPWSRVTKKYVFDSATKGERSLADLFEGRSQLIVYHFMFAPDWEAGCKSCSFWADNFERNVIHLAHRDATMIAISRAPIEKLEAYKKRLGWTFEWVSSMRTDFNFDFHVSFDAARQQEPPTYNYRPKTSAMPELPGISVFARNLDDQSSSSDDVFHTYSTYARGIDMMNAAYHFIDLLPKGRDESAGIMSWLRRRDEYES